MQKLTFFPNPVSENLLIDWRNESSDAYVQVEVLMYGRMILDQKCTFGPILQVSFRGLAEGIYHVQSERRTRQVFRDRFSFQLINFWFESDIFVLLQRRNVKKI